VPAAEYASAAEPGLYKWPDGVSGNWRVVEWTPARGAWSLEEGSALVGGVARLRADEVRVPGYTCEQAAFEMSDTGRFWKLFEQCENGVPGYDCRDVEWTGQTMLGCAGRGPESEPTALAEVTADCLDGEGLPFTFSKVSSARALVTLLDVEAISASSSWSSIWSRQNDGIFGGSSGRALAVVR
jgi:hypothetical protein